MFCEVDRDFLLPDVATFTLDVDAPLPRPVG
jgi:hypothetical protein